MGQSISETRVWGKLIVWITVKPSKECFRCTKVMEVEAPEAGAESYSSVAGLSMARHATDNINYLLQYECHYAPSIMLLAHDCVSCRSQRLRRWMLKAWHISFNNIKKKSSLASLWTQLIHFFLMTLHSNFIYSESPSFYAKTESFNINQSKEGAKLLRRDLSLK